MHSIATKVDAAARVCVTGVRRRGSAAGDLVRLGLAERQHLAVFARLAVGARHRLAAIRPARQTLIDAVAVGLIFHNEDLGFGAGREGQTS